MKIVTIPLALFLLGAPTAQAGEADCQTQPTQACVLEMAFAQAIASPTAGRMAAGFMAIADVQRAEGSDQYIETLRRMLIALKVTDLDLDRVRQAYLEKRLLFTSHTTSADAESSKKIAVSIDDTPRSHEALSVYLSAELAASRTRFETLIADAPSDDVARFAGLPKHWPLPPPILYEPWETAPKDLSGLRQQTVSRMVNKLAFVAAEAMVASWPQGPDRTNGYVKIAKGLAKVGELESALRLARRLAASDLASADPFAFIEAAETYARAGDPVNSRWLLGQAKQARNQFIGLDREVSKILFIGALVDQDFELALDVLATEKETWHAHFALLFGIDAYLTAGHTKIEEFLAALPPAYWPDGLEGLGYYQVETGDIAGALVTLQRLDALGPGKKPDTYIDIRLILMLAATGQTVPAVRLANDLKNAAVTAQLASLIK